MAIALSVVPDRRRNGGGVVVRGLWLVILMESWLGCGRKAVLCHVMKLVAADTL